MTSRHLNSADVEAVLAGDPPADADLAVLSDVIDGLRRVYVSEPDDAHVAGLSGRLAAVAAAAPLDGGPVGASRSRSSGRRRGAIALGIAGIVAVGFGSAAAADDAAPGDFLYGLDRALEAIGINDGGAHERLSEVQTLLAAGDIDEALEASVEAVEDMDDLGDEEAAELTGLLNAAESVLKDGSEQSAERREQVAAMLTFMAETELTGKEFGQAVSQQARGIVEDEAADASGAESEDVTTDGSEDATDEAPGNSGGSNGNSSNSNSSSNGNSSNSNSSSNGSSSNGNSSNSNSSNSNSSSNGNSSDSGPNENANPNATAETKGNSGKDK